MPPEKETAGTPSPEGGTSPSTARVCLGCGLVLPPEPEGELCRRCMFPLVASLQDAGQTFAATGRVNADVFCHQCGYNLRGLSREGRCPECATSVAVSLQHDLLCFAEPGYVRKLAWGNRLAGWGWLSLLIFVFGLLGLIFLFMFSVATATGDEQLLLGLCFGGLVIAAFFGGWLFLMIGAWLLTARQPQVFVPAGRLKARQVVRYFLLSLPLAVGVYIVLATVATPVWLGLSLSLLFFLLAGAGVAAVTALFRSLESTARRLPDSKLSRQARQIGNQFGLTLGLVIGFSLILSLLSWAGATGFATGAFTATTSSTTAPATPRPTGLAAAANVVAQPVRIVGGCTSTVCWIYLVVLAFRARGWHVAMQQRLTRHLAFAEKHWARGGGGAQ